MPSSIFSLRAERFHTNPLITPYSSLTLGENINGPSVIRVPAWLPSPLGEYYMYFAHHSGEFIRLAYADRLEGPWRIYEEGTLHLREAEVFRDHIASPDVHVDEDSKQIRLYFHGPAQGCADQWTGVAFSSDGIHFRALRTLLGLPYFRCWRWEDHWYALAKRNNDGWGDLLRSPDGLNFFEQRSHFIPRMRHAAVVVLGNQLVVVYSRVGDAPERLLWATVDLTPSEWKDWRISQPNDLLAPELHYEGSAYQQLPSVHGPATSVCQLRDPALLLDEHKLSLYYTVAGESSIAGAHIEFWTHA